MVKQIPLALKLGNRMVRRPAQHRLQDPPAIRERPERAVARGVHQVVRVAGRVREVVLPAVLVHPRGLEEAPVVVVRGQRLARLPVQDPQLLRRARKLQHVLAQARHAREQRRHARAASNEPSARQHCSCPPQMPPK